MSTLELNKIVGAILVAALVAMVVGMIGDGLVKPRTDPGTAVATDEGARAPATAAREPEKLEPIAPLMANASAERGKAAFTPCASCHTVDKGGRNGVGPNLWNVVNAEMATHEGFNFSSALKNKGGKWSYEDLNAFLHRPQTFARGTRMAFPGVPQAERRADIIAFLRSLADDPAPLPDAN